MRIRTTVAIVLLSLLGSNLLAAAPATRPTLERIAISADGHKLVHHPSNRLFTPWGFNYDRDYKSRLIEDYWITEWPTVERDFRNMKSLGANIVRIHLSLSQFLDAPDQPNAKNVAQLKRLVSLCEDLGLYLDVTGLGGYRKESIPPWYTNTTEQQRWAIQAQFWSVISEACAHSPAIAWYDLANEPAVPGDKQKPGEWMAGHLGDFWYCQFITLDPAGRDRGQIARAWVKQLSAPIRQHDPDALITVGMLPFTSSPGQPSIGIDPPALHDLLDLICVHIYPKAPPFKDALSLAERFDTTGKPLVIEEIFPLECQPADLPSFFKASSSHVDGWIGFYWGQTPEELSHSTTLLDAITRDWLKVFQSSRPAGVE